MQRPSFIVRNRATLAVLLLGSTAFIAACSS